MRARTSLMTWIFLSPAATRMTSNSSCSSAAAARRHRRPAPAAATADRGRGGHAELFLEGLEELVQLEDGHVLEGVEELFSGHGGHGRCLSWCLAMCGFGLGAVPTRRAPRRLTAPRGSARSARRSRRPRLVGGLGARRLRSAALRLRARRPRLRRCFLGGRLRAPATRWSISALHAEGHVAGERLEQAGGLAPAAPGIRRRAGPAAPRGAAARRAPDLGRVRTLLPSSPPLTISAGLVRPKSRSALAALTASPLDERDRCRALEHRRQLEAGFFRGPSGPACS